MNRRAIRWYGHRDSRRPNDRNSAGRAAVLVRPEMISGTMALSLSMCYARSTAGRPLPSPLPTRLTLLPERLPCAHRRAPLMHFPHDPGRDPRRRPGRVDLASGTHSVVRCTTCCAPESAHGPVPPSTDEVDSDVVGGQAAIVSGFVGSWGYSCRDGWVLSASSLTLAV